MDITRVVADGHEICVHFAPHHDLPFPFTHPTYSSPLNPAHPPTLYPLCLPISAVWWPPASQHRSSHPTPPHTTPIGLGTYTWSHRYMIGFSNEGAFAELNYTMEAIKLVTAPSSCASLRFGSAAWRRKALWLPLAPRDVLIRFLSCYPPAAGPAMGGSSGSGGYRAYLPCHPAKPCIPLPPVPASFPLPLPSFPSPLSFATPNPFPPTAPLRRRRRPHLLHRGTAPARDHHVVLAQFI
ncbi:hypothetical protein B0H10DRAFT_2218523 [Mycena sp. CBHHK59/15]|nr:hypothetical protein B0H10DRAFT_2218523 [Mycena sp. CBHHK59/15]